MKKTGAHNMKRKDKSHEKLLLNVRKTEKDSNFMASKRITMPPKFLSLNVISETASKNHSSSGSASKENENVYGIFGDNPSTNLRRSARLNDRRASRSMDSLSKQFINNNFMLNSTETSFYDNSKEEQKLERKRKCKSLFKEINRRYAESENPKVSKNLDCNRRGYNRFVKNLSQDSHHKTNNFNENFGLWTASDTNLKSDVFGINERSPIFQNNSLVNTFSSIHFNKDETNTDFSDRLSNQLLDDIGSFKEHAIAECKNKIKEKIHAINYILKGNVSKLSQQIFTRNHSDEVSDPLDMTFELLPESKWKFETPSKERLVKHNIPKQTMKPAFVYKNEDNYITHIVELNPTDITIDLTKFEFQEDSSQKLPFVVKPTGFYTENITNFNRGHNNFFDAPSCSFGHSGKSLTSSQQPSRLTQQSSFNFQPNFPSTNFFSNI